MSYKNKETKGNIEDVKDRTRRRIQKVKEEESREDKE